MATLDGLVRSLRDAAATVGFRLPRAPDGRPRVGITELVFEVDARLVRVGGRGEAGRLVLELAPAPAARRRTGRLVVRLGGDDLRDVAVSIDGRRLLTAGTPHRAP